MTGAPVAAAPVASPENVFAQAFLQATNAILITDADIAGGGPFIVHANPAFCRMSGYRLEELVGRSPRILQGPRTDRKMLDALREHLEQGLPFSASTVNYAADGRAYTVEWSIAPVRAADGVVRHFVSVQNDITARIAGEQERRLLLQALNASQDPILITDRKTRVVFANEAFRRLTGYAADEILGESARMLYPSPRERTSYRTLRTSLRDGKAFRATFTYRRKNGSPFYVEQSIAPVLDAAGRVTHYISTGKDVSERVEREHHLLEIASRDSLTGLYNRLAGSRMLDALIGEAQASGRPFSLILADLDHFKAINDSRGHQAGDDALVAVGGILQAGIRGGDLAIRWGGEEFLILVPGCGIAQAMELAERLRTGVAGAQIADAGPITVSLGVAQLAAGESAAALLQRADDALYRAKSSGRNRAMAAEPG
ncbi:MAG: diguanylate cyclase [Lysobacteraceae bacterium SCN 69-48]|nr:MAG: diguanylate cyclase [Xanthomonadaceae bacterium SCN 69-48]